MLSSWWREYAECSEGPRERQSSSSKADTESFMGHTQSSQLYEIEEERVGVPVKGGLYEVDLVKRHCFPVYWNGENRRVLRGHWFARKGGLDWLPLREDVAEQLEIAYSSQVCMIIEITFFRAFDFSRARQSRCISTKDTSLM